MEKYASNDPLITISATDLFCVCSCVIFTRLRSSRGSKETQKTATQAGITG